MGRNGNWFSSVKKALSPETKKSKKSKKKWFGKQKLQDSNAPLEPVTTAPLPQMETKLVDVKKESSPVDSIPVATSAADVEASVSPPQASVEVVQLQHATVARFAGKGIEEVAVIKIQTAFRGYMARRALRALRGLVRLKSLMEGPAVERQVTSTLRSMQTLARVQCQINSRRVRMLEENQALQRQILQKHAKELESVRIGEEWDDSLQSKEQIEAKLLNKYEAAMRRERAMAYAFSHQQTWKNSARSINPMFMDPTNPTWGWSWLERWMTARSGESHSTAEKELYNDHSSVKSASRSGIGGEISKLYARYQLNSDKHSPAASQKPSASTFQLNGTPKPASAARKLKSVSPKGCWGMDDDSKSMASIRSERPRRHSIAGSLVRDDESLASSPALPSYMVPTQSAKAKLRMQSPLTPENWTPEKGSFAKKRLSFPSSPAKPRRHSGPPKVESNLNAETTVGNGLVS